MERHLLELHVVGHIQGRGAEARNSIGYGCLEITDDVSDVVGRQSEHRDHDTPSSLRNKICMRLLVALGVSLPGPLSADEYLAAPIRHDDQQAAPGPLALGARWAERQVGRRTQHLAHLHLRERCTGAATDTATEWDPRQPLGLR